MSTEFLAGYLPMLADAATIGRAPKRAEIDAVRLQGRHAAESGVPVGRGVDLYLSAARRVWAELPAVVRQRDNRAVRAAAEALLQVVDEAVASFADGHAEAGRELDPQGGDPSTRPRRRPASRRRPPERAGRASRTLRPRPDPRPSGRPRPTRQAPAIDRGRHHRSRACRAGSLRRPRCPGGHQGRHGRGPGPGGGDGSPCHLDGTGHDRKPRQDDPQRAQPTPPWLPLAGRGRTSAPGRLRDRTFLRGGPRRTDHGGPDAPGQARSSRHGTC